MDYEKEIQQLKEKIAFYEQFFHELSAPIIPSIVENTILVPVAGYLTQDRLESIRTRVLDYMGDHREINCAVIDFTGVEIKDIEQLDYTIFAHEIRQVDASLKLMGIRPIFVGFNPRLVREIVQERVHVTIETYVNFKTALATLLKCTEKTLHSFE